MLFINSTDGVLIPATKSGVPFTIQHSYHMMRLIRFSTAEQIISSQDAYYF